MAFELKGFGAIIQKLCVLTLTLGLWKFIQRTNLIDGWILVAKALLNFCHTDRCSYTVVFCFLRLSIGRFLMGLCRWGRSDFPLFLRIFRFFYAFLGFFYAFFRFFFSLFFVFLRFSLLLLKLAKRRWSLESAGCLEWVFLICCWMPQCVMPHMHNACETDSESLQH